MEIEYSPRFSKKFKKLPKEVKQKALICEKLFRINPFDPKLKILGKVPLSELESTIKSLNGGIYAVALDGDVSSELSRLAEKLSISHIVGTGSKSSGSVKVNILTDENLN